MKIVILDGKIENPGDLSWEGLENLGELTVYEDSREDQVLERIGDADAILTNKVVMNGETMDACPNLKYIGVMATGYNVIDVKAAGERGIAVTNVPGYGTGIVSQYTMAMLLEICHYIGHHSEAVHQGRWSGCGDWCFWDYDMMELTGKTMGIIGYGKIGQAVARLAGAFGMRVLAYSPSRKVGTKDEAGIGFVELNQIFEESDVISLHCPMTERTAGIINKDSIQKMKDGVILINTSRGGLVVDQDLAKALNDGKIRAAGLDVISQEPIAEDNPLLTAKNCLITPHIAWAAREARQKIMDIVVDNLTCYQQGIQKNRVEETNYE
ncbi:MAG: D-2-hydroxyacid dehydrogenase [Clostridiales bacterium]|nr:D-2-hydroxyacid dehydrogenase [Clostridiales bacterium]